MSSRVLYVWDIDGCLADNTKAAKLAGPEPDRTKEPEAYRAWVKVVMKDFEQFPPVPPLFILLRRLYTDSYTPCVVLTARNEQHRPLTEEWLKKQFPSTWMPRLIMRPKENRWPSAKLKESIIKDLVVQYQATDVVWVDDDERAEMQPIASANGWVFLKTFLPKGK